MAAFGETERTPAEDEEDAFGLCLPLPLVIRCTEANRQRGEWLMARVHTVLGETAPALQHARRSLELSEAYRDQMKDFDIAYAYEGMARANALGGDRATARQYLEKAEAAGRAIADPEDKEIFMGDLEGGAWYGIR
jgi:hypothetical protein